MINSACLESTGFHIGKRGNLTGTSSYTRNPDLGGLQREMYRSQRNAPVGSLEESTHKFGIGRWACVVNGEQACFLSRPVPRRLA